MPVKRRRLSRKYVLSSEPLTECLEYYLMYGKYGTRKGSHLPGSLRTFQMNHPNHRDELKAAWIEHKATILKKWRDLKLEGKPWAEKEFSV